MKKTGFIVLAVVLLGISPVLADTVLKGQKPESFPCSENCAKCHNVQKIYDELVLSIHSDLTCLDCHVPGDAQKSKYEAKNRTFYRLGYYKGNGQWLETSGNKVCLQCHEDRKKQKIENKCWECHMQVEGTDDFVLLKDKKLPPKEDNIKIHKRFPHRVHSFVVHSLPEKEDVKNK